MDYKEIVEVCTRKNKGFSTYRKDLPYQQKNVVYLLYSDNTWEEFLVYEGLYWGKAECNAKLNLYNRLVGKTQHQAIVIIEKMINEGRLIGTLLV